MNEEKSKNSFSHYVLEGDWLGYKNEVSKQSNSLYQELGKKFPPLAKLDKLLLSTSKRDRVKGKLFLVMIYIALLLLTSIFSQIFQLLLMLVVYFTTHISMVYIVISRRHKELNIVRKVICILPCMICILYKHSSYIAKILWKNQIDAFFTLVSIFTAFWSVFAFNKFIVISLFYNNVKHCDCESMYMALLIVSPVALLVAVLNVFLLIGVFNKKCDSCGKGVNHWAHEVNRTSTIAVCFFSSFVSVYALILHPTKVYINAVSTMVIVFVFLLEKLLFGNNNQKRV